MAKRADAEIATLIQLLCSDSALRLAAVGDGRYDLQPRSSGRATPISEASLRRLCARGLLVETGSGKFAAAPAARAWLRRRASADRPFRMQHGEIVETRAAGDRDRDVLVNLDESPVASLARRLGKGGTPWLSADLTTAAERLRHDFEIGRLQPRVTANWSASVNDGRRTGNAGGLTDLTDMALAARLRVDRAMRDVGPELSGVLIDICCFLKGLETVERERQWPARSAKLVLRMALLSLARHYGLTPTGRQAGLRQAAPLGGGRLPAGGHVEARAEPASAASASRRMRASMEERPFDRCDVRCSRKPIRAKTASGSVSTISSAVLPE